jgi:lysozyme family protein
MTDVFDKAFDIVIGHEGGLSLSPGDPGNWTGGAVGIGTLAGTNWGISAKAYPAIDIKALTRADAAAIYRRDYWDRIAADHLPPPLALLLFDAAVNAGVAHAVRWLQSALGIPVDGGLGPTTLAAVQAASGTGAALLTEFMAQRIAYSASLPTWKLFGLGWARRFAALPYQAMSLSS